MTDDTGSDDDLGWRLRAVRRARGLSQRALARQAGVSNAMISLVESGRSNPSVGLLKRILDGVPMSLGEFFAERTDTARVFYRAEELTEISRGPVTMRQVGGELRERRLQIMQETYAPGADTGRAMLRHEAEEGGIVLSGHIELSVAGASRLLGPGDAYLFDSRQPHRFRNRSERQTAVLISACTPPSF
ncbi:MAG TPA: cupin domain-containing protein [Pseudomonadales bacterium]|nr:cupin domain-containing protein [Pseudomonadales bacterium]